MPRQGSPAETADAPQTLSAGRRPSLGQGVVSEDVAKILRGRKRSKYGNVKVTLDGITFDSQKEAARYEVLKLLVQAGEICCLEVHPRFPLVVHGIDCGYYEGDFGYVDHGSPAVEDVKSAATRKLPTYRLKAKMVWALYGIKIREI